MDIIIVIIVFYFILKNLKSNTTLESLLNQRNFANIKAEYATKYISQSCITAEKSSMKYLFVKYTSDISPKGIVTLMQNIQSLSKTLKCDRVIIYYYNIAVPLELTKIAATYNIEIWNKNGTSNFESYRTTIANTNNSRLAKTLSPETTPFEHRPNGVIAKDTCHIAPSTSPIKENPKSLFKKKEPQRL